MGRAGIEPATLGLRVDDGLSGRLARYSPQRLTEPNHLGSSGVLSHRLVDLLLTQSAVCVDNNVRSHRALR
jgi:hypothetical protein